MNIDDVISSQVDDAGETCAVCGKSVAGGGGFRKIKVETQTIALCCPLCVKTFEQNPGDFLRRQTSQAESHALFDLLRQQPPAK